MATPAPQINQYFDQFHQKCTTIFHKMPCQWQVEVGGSILRLHSDNNERNQLLVQKTGEGTSLVFLVTGACIGGITLCISPLLSLAMDQNRKVLKHADSKYTYSPSNFVDFIDQATTKCVHIHFHISAVLPQSTLILKLSAFERSHQVCSC